MKRRASRPDSYRESGLAGIQKDIIMLANFRKSLVFGCIALIVILGSFSFRSPLASSANQEDLDINDDTPVWDIFTKLGKIKINQVNTKVQGVSAEKGKDIIYKGYSTKQDGTGKTSMQSPHFKCTACHVPEREFENLADINSAKKLEYAVENDLPFLQGSSFYGIVNRIHFYNGDYQKKYAGVPLIKESYNDIRSAIQLCATQCAQGRALEDWEIESVLAYFWTMELKIKDIGIKKEDIQIVQEAINSGKGGQKAIHTLEGHYMNLSPATFSTADLDYKEIESADKNNKERFRSGMEIYQRSCLHCHGRKRYSFFNLDKSGHSFKYLLSKTKAGGFHSIFKITRHGTYSLNGKKAYMPQYPMEKMTDNQLMDLRIYIENMAEGNNLLANSK